MRGYAREANLEPNEEDIVATFRIHEVNENFSGRGILPEIQRG